MNKITNFNCDRKCNEDGCDTDYEYYERLDINGMVLFIALCKKHAEKWEENRIEWLRTEENARKNKKNDNEM